MRPQEEVMRKPKLAFGAISERELDIAEATFMNALRMLLELIHIDSGSRVQLRSHIRAKLEQIELPVARGQARVRKKRGK